MSETGMFESVKGLLDEHKAVQEELSDPAVHADAGRAKRVNRRYAELSRIVHAYEAWAAASDDLEAARELASEDAAFADEVPALEEKAAAAQEKRCEQRAHVFVAIAVVVAEPALRLVERERCQNESDVGAR